MLQQTPTAPDPASVMPRSLLDLVASVDNVPPDFESNCAPFYRLRLSPDPRTHGYVHPDTVARMPWPASFVVDHPGRAVTLSAPPAEPGTSPSAHASAAFQAAVDAALERGAFPATLNGMHSEHFLIPGARGLVRVERFAASLFGIATRGAHLTCYVRAAQQQQQQQQRLEVWVARRGRQLLTYPGMLDSTVAGGVQAHHSPLECVLAEAAEEASLPRGLVADAVRSAGVVTLANRSARTGLVHSEVLYVYDLELARHVVPRPQDGEVDEFVLMDCDQLVRRMLAGEFKPNVCPVMIDFLIRHGELTPEGVKDYVDLCARLKRRLPVPTTSDG
ncbi:hypothetical protein UVI_02063070 [Ustilaginoidea virens]|nr:hypothetical protein UVI_02063070 [Ustilaginoidea virens]